MASRAATVLLLALGVVDCRWGCTLPPETLAIADLRTIDAALRAYRAACGAYPARFEAVSPRDHPPVRTSPPCTSVVRLEEPIVARVAAGLTPAADRPYALLYDPDGPGERGFQNYRLEARWLGRSRDERPSFWTSDAGVWTSAAGRPATERDEPLR